MKWRLLFELCEGCCCCWMFVDDENDLILVEIKVVYISKRSQLKLRGLHAKAGNASHGRGGSCPLRSEVRQNRRGAGFRKAGNWRLCINTTEKVS